MLSVGEPTSTIRLAVDYLVGPVALINGLDFETYGANLV